MSEAAKLDQAFEDRAQHIAVFAYVARGINLCVDCQLIEATHRTKMSATEKGMRMLGALNFSEAELRECFTKMVNSGHISEFLEYDQVFVGVVSRGETIH